MGEPGAKNGEKKLRSGLSHSEEWACSITRNRTADALEAAARAPGAPPDAPADAATLAAALRSRDSAKLRTLQNGGANIALTDSSLGS